MAELISKTYSTALFEVAKEENILQQILEELKFVNQTVKEFPEFYNLLKTPKINISEKKEIIETVFKGKLSKETNNFLKILIDKRREKYIPEITEDFEDMYCEDKGIMRGKAISAVAMTDNQLKKLTASLEKSIGKTVLLKNVVDPKLMGGVMLKFGDKVVDGSVKGKLTELENSLNKIIM